MDINKEHHRIWQSVEYEPRDAIVHYSIDVRIAEYRQHFKTHWRNRSQWYWLWRLIQEVWELTLALAGLHNDPIDLELSQIAGICANWREMREAAKD